MIVYNYEKLRKEMNDLVSKILGKNNELAIIHTTNLIMAKIVLHDNKEVNLNEN